MSIPQRILEFFNESHSRVYTSRELRSEYGKKYGALNARIFCNSINRLLKKDRLQRSSNRTNEGYLFTLDNFSGLKTRFEEYLIPQDFPNRSYLLSLLNTDSFKANQSSKEEKGIHQTPLSKEYPKRYLGYKKVNLFLAKLVAFSMGDGHLNLNHNKLVLCFFLKEDACKFRSDFSTFFPRHSCILYKGDGCFNCAINQYSFVQSLFLLGAPSGNKVYQSFLIPSWIVYGSPAIKKAFLSVIIGNEGSKPSKQYRRIQFVISKNEKYIEHLLLFINQIKQMLACFGINSTYTQLRKQVGRNYYARFYIRGEENLELFYRNIGFSYASEKQEGLTMLFDSHQEAT
ncbi:MAG: LAGLIDADG family homing endonuclease [Nanoarchaeota archaeon]|nr:LAGLIDADG family homing endonuclease [Nanoarchaeota archaeon]